MRNRLLVPALTMLIVDLLIAWGISDYFGGGFQIWLVVVSIVLLVIASIAALSGLIVAKFLNRRRSPSSTRSLTTTKG